MQSLLVFQFTFKLNILELICFTLCDVYHCLYSPKVAEKCLSDHAPQQTRLAEAEGDRGTLQDRELLS